MTPPSVIVPDDLSIEEDPTAPRKRVPVVPIAVVAGLVLVVGSLFVFSNSNRGTPDPSQDPPTSVVVPAAPTTVPAAITATRIDSGAIAIGSLPTTARVTLDGKVVSERRLSLLPGRYQLVVTAPGYKTVSQGVVVIAGQTLEWSPPMQSRKSVASASPARDATPPKAVASAPDCLNAYSDKNWSAALLACTREANAGNQSAQRNLGAIYDQGLGIDKNAEQAAIWYRKAAGTGNRDATFQLATMYENGRGVPQDQKQAIGWYRKAALLGDADSQIKLGRAYMEGKGVARDEGEAAAWFQRAADQENLYALNRLGAMYADGKGVRKDEARGVKMFQAAAAKGDAQGQFNLAAMYAKGRGIQKSDSAANDLYVKAAKQGYADAINEARHRNLKF
jgi:TPR repeat protein